MLTQTINLDILNEKPSEEILARYGETGRTIRIHVYNSSTGVDVDLSTMESVKLQMYKPDGNFIIQSATISGGDAVVTLSEQMTASYGRGYIDLKLVDSVGDLYTCHAVIVIDTPLSTDDIIESVSVVNGYIFPDDFQLKLRAGNAIYFSGDDDRTINARATDLEAGVGIDITGDEISLDSETIDKLAEIDNKQEELTAGAGISIENNVIMSTSQGMEFEAIMNWQVSYQAGSTHAITKPITGYKLVVLELINPAGQIAGGSVFNPASVSYTKQNTIMWFALNSMRNITFSFSDASTFKLDNAGISGGTNFAINLYGLK